MPDRASQRFGVRSDRTVTLMLALLCHDPKMTAVRRKQGINFLNRHFVPQGGSIDKELLDVKHTHPPERHPPSPHAP